MRFIASAARRLKGRTRILVAFIAAYATVEIVLAQPAFAAVPADPIDNCTAVKATKDMFGLGLNNAKNFASEYWWGFVVLGLIALGVGGVARKTTFGKSMIWAGVILGFAVPAVSKLTIGGGPC